MKPRARAKKTATKTPLASVSIQTRREASFDAQLVVTLVTVVLEQFGKAVLGELAKSTWAYIRESVRKLRGGHCVEAAYRTPILNKNGVELFLSYASAKDLRADLEHHPLYLAVAAGYAQNSVAGAANAVVSFASLVPDDQPHRPQRIVLRPLSKS